MPGTFNLGRHEMSELPFSPGWYWGPDAVLGAAIVRRARDTESARRPGAWVQPGHYGCWRLRQEDFRFLEVSSAQRCWKLVGVAGT